MVRVRIGVRVMVRVPEIDLKLIRKKFRPALEIHNRDHVRVIQTREFYSKNGIGLG